MQLSSDRVHATCIALGPAAALIRGPSGAGKSDLALRFLMQAPTAVAPPGERRLVADDQVELTRAGPTIKASAPATLADKLEVRGVGIVAVTTHALVTVVTVVDLVPLETVERMPEHNGYVELLGIRLPHHTLFAAEASAHLKLALLIDKYAKSKG